MLLTLLAIFTNNLQQILSAYTMASVHIAKSATCWQKTDSSSVWLHCRCCHNRECMKRPTADKLLLYKKLSEIRDAAKLLITQLLSPLKHHSISICAVISTTSRLLRLNTKHNNGTLTQTMAWTSFSYNDATVCNISYMYLLP